MIDNSSQFDLLPQKISVSQEHLRYVTEEEIQDSGIRLVISEVAEEIRQKYISKVLGTDKGNTNIQRSAYRDFISRVLDKTVENFSSVPLPDMSYDEIVDYMSFYAWGGMVKYEYYEEAIAVTLHNMDVTIQSDDNIGISEVSTPGKYNFGFKWFNNTKQHHLRAIVLLDAVIDELKIRLDPIMIEVEAAYKAEQIYLAYANKFACSLTEKYSGETMISHKPNRMTIHFYLSGKEKAIITFYKDKMPWPLLEPPTDPDSLRGICSQKNSPFIIVSLSKQDRRYLKK